MKKLLLKAALLILFAAPFLSKAQQYDGIPYPCPNYPTGGAPSTIPGLIPFAYHDCGDDGVAYHNVAGSGDCAKNTTNVNRGTTTPTQGICEAWKDTTVKGGWMVGWLANNEWMNYTVNITKATKYKLVIFYAICCNRVVGESSQITFSYTPTGGTETILTGADLDLMNNLGADKADSAVFDDISLPKGYGKFKATVTGEGLNLMAFELIDPATIGIADNNNNLSFSIFPNPVNDKLTLQLPNNNNNVNIIITDVAGKEILNENTNSKHYEFNTSKLNSGMYFVTINNSTSSVTKKFVKK